jgi:hypothetical protein
MNEEERRKFLYKELYLPKLDEEIAFIQDQLKRKDEIMKAKVPEIFDLKGFKKPIKELYFDGLEADLEYALKLKEEMQSFLDSHEKSDE